MKFLKRIWQGAGYLEGYGHHPGTAHVLILILCCGLAGMKNTGHWDGGVWAFLGGVAWGSLFFLPFYFAGCYSRAKDYEQDVETTFKRLQKEY